MDRKVILRNMSAAAGGGFSADSIDSLRKHDATILQTAATAAGEAYKRAVDFLVTQIKIPGDSIVPYANQIVVLAELFRSLPSPTADQYEQIHRWFWRTAASGYFSGWNTGMMSADQKLVERFAKGESTEIDVGAIQPRPEIWSGRTFRMNGAHAKTLAILLSYRRPIDLLTGQEIDVSKAMAWTNSKEFHHFFPREYLKGLDVISSKINCLANIIMLTSSSNKFISGRAPSDYLADVAHAAGGDLEKWLAFNLIPMSAYEAATKDEFETRRLDLSPPGLQKRLRKLDPSRGRRAAPGRRAPA